MNNTEITAPVHLKRSDILSIWKEKLIKFSTLNHSSICTSCQWTFNVSTYLPDSFKLNITELSACDSVDKYNPTSQAFSLINERYGRLGLNRKKWKGGD